MTRRRWNTLTQRRTVIREWPAGSAEAHIVATHRAALHRHPADIPPSLWGVFLGPDPAAEITDVQVLVETLEAVTWTERPDAEAGIGVKTLVLTEALFAEYLERVGHDGFEIMLWGYRGGQHPTRGHWTSGLDERAAEVYTQLRRDGTPAAAAAVLAAGATA